MKSMREKYRTHETKKFVRLGAERWPASCGPDFQKSSEVRYSALRTTANQSMLWAEYQDFWASRCWVSNEEPMQPDVAMANSITVERGWWLPIVATLSWTKSSQCDPFMGLRGRDVAFIMAFQNSLTWSPSSTETIKASSESEELRNAWWKVAWITALATQSTGSTNMKASFI